MLLRVSTAVAAMLILIFSFFRNVIFEKGILKRIRYRVTKSDCKNHLDSIPG
jgi:hypothetical protein